MTQQFADAARAELASSINSSDTSLTIVTGGSLFPVANTGSASVGPAADWFKLVVQDEDGIEIIYCRTHTSGSNTFSNLLRGQDGTAARGFDDVHPVTGQRTVVGLRLVASDGARFEEAAEDVDSHIASTSNPHGVTKAQVGLGNVDNTADSAKPISTLTQAALNGKEATIAAGTTAQYWRGNKTWRDFFTDVRAATLTGLSTATGTAVAAADTVLVAIGKLQKQITDNLATLTGHTSSTSNPHGVTKAQVGLGSVDNTSDANKPVSGATLSRFGGATSTSGVLDWNATANTQPGIGPTLLLGSHTNGPGGGNYYFVWNLEYGPNKDGSGQITQIALPYSNQGSVNEGLFKFRGRYSGNWTPWEYAFTTVTPPAIADVTGLAAALNAKAPLASPTFTGTVGGITKAMVGLGSVDNTADSAKPVSSAQQTALNAKAPLASPTFTGTVTVPTVAGNDSAASRLMFKDCGFAYHNANTGTTLSYTNGSHQRWAPTGTVTLAVSNWPPSGNLGELLIEGVNLGAATITWPTVNWVLSDGTTSTTFADTEAELQASGTDWVLLWTRDAGTTIYGKVVR